MKKRGTTSSVQVMIIVFVLLAGAKAYASTDYLPMPFPLASPGKHDRSFSTQIEGGYTTLTSDHQDITYSTLSMKSVFKGAENSRLWYHLSLSGGSFEGDVVNESFFRFYQLYGYETGTFTSPGTLDGTFASVALTPSVVLTNRISWMKPLAFLGVMSQFSDQEADVPQNVSLQLNSDEWTRPVYNPYDSAVYSKETFTSGFHAGMQACFDLGFVAIDPFYMFQYAQVRVSIDGEELSATEDTDYSAHTVGVDIRCLPFHMSLTVMAQFIDEDNSEDTDVFTLQTGFFF